MSSKELSGAGSALMRVLHGLLRPLVRTLIAYGLTAPTVYRLLKRIYVEVAHEDFRIADTPPTDSRITLLTGVHRRDVREILTSDAESWTGARQKSTVFATVVGQWLANPDYLDDAGNPLVLPRSGELTSFESLVRLVSTDLRARTVLDELLRLGLVEEVEDGLALKSEQAVFGSGSDEHKTVFFAANVGDHLAAAAENLLAPEPPFLERAVFYNHLSETSIDQIEAMARTESQTVLNALNKQSAQFQKQDRSSPGPKQRYRFGVYFYREDADVKDTTPSEKSN